MQTTAHSTTRYRHRKLERNTPQCTNKKCSRIQNEIKTAVSGATEVHHALCSPEWQRIENFEIATRIIPAHHVGGDFVCTLKAGEFTVAVLGDMMGKGLPAAMWITHIIDLVHRSAENFETLPELMAKLNGELIKSRVRAPLTSAIAMAIDGKSGEVSCASAGHPPAILLRGDASTEMMSEGGPLLGVFADAQYKARTVRLEQGDAIVAFSDGVIEVERNSEEQFSLAHVTRTLARHTSLCARQKLLALLDASRAFAEGRVVDDVSALIVQHA